MQWREPDRIALTLGALVSAGVASLAELGTTPFWVDEAISVLPAREILTQGVPRSPFDLDFMRFQLKDGVWDPSAPLYRYMLAAFVAVTGFSESTTRLFSVFWGAATVGLTVLIARRIAGAKVAWLTAIVLLTTPDFIAHAREARHFTFVGAAMLLTVYGLIESREGRPRGAAIWPVGVTVAFLSHATGYLIAPAVVLTVLVCGPKHFFAKRWLPLYVGLVGVTSAVVLPNLETLPFLHEVSCRNRTAGCDPSTWYYLGTIAVFVTSSHSSVATVSGLGCVLLALPLTALLLGLAVTAARASKRSSDLIVLLAISTPLLVLSTRELKFPRYLFYSLPLLSFLISRGAAWATECIKHAGTRHAMMTLSAVVLVFLPTYSDGAWDSRWIHTLSHSLKAPPDNWERIKEKARLVQEHASPEDIVVTSFDDASLAYYSGRFVHGFLNSQHDDSHFLGLLERARLRNASVVFIDTLPSLNYCHTTDSPLRNIDCRDKYPYFYRACLAQSADSLCQRHPF